MLHAPQSAAPEPQIQVVAERAADLPNPARKRKHTLSVVDGHINAASMLGDAVQQQQQQR
jgi:hypothetical protein